MVRNLEAMQEPGRVVPISGQGRRLKTPNLSRESRRVKDVLEPGSSVRIQIRSEHRLVIREMNDLSIFQLSKRIMRLFFCWWTRMLRKGLEGQQGLY
jgi:hypothetical protein